jgi:hypothetical protein
MPDWALSAELMRRHREIGTAIRCFIEKLDGGNRHPELLRETMDALRRHIYLHADDDLPAPTSAQLTRFVVTGRIPDGWVCQQAGTKRAR